MKIVVDINHPAHVHYFKNLIWKMEEKGNQFLITASEKDVALNLLKNYGFNYINMGSYGATLTRKLLNVPLMDLRMYKSVKDFKPDCFIGFGSIRAAHASKFMGKFCINLEDTEHTKWENRAYIPFTDSVLTPNCFRENLGRKQFRYNGYTELAYLHPNYFTPNSSVLDGIGLSKGDPFVVVRFVSWTASHDIGQHGIKNKVKLVQELEKYGRVLVTSEGPLPNKLEKYRIKVPPENLHDLLYYAMLHIGEGGTTASEAAILGTPSIVVSTKVCGYLYDQHEKYGLTYIFSDPIKGSDQALIKAIELLNKSDLKKDFQKKSKKLIDEHIDVTEFMVRFVGNYPESVY